VLKGGGLTLSTQPLDPEDDTVIIGDNGVLCKSESKTTTNCSFSAKIHEDPKPFLSPIMSDQPTDGKLLFQKVVENERSSKAKKTVVVYWSFMVEKTKTSCDLLLCLTVEKDGDEIRIGVEQG